MIKVTEEMTKERFWESLTSTEYVELGTKLAALLLDVKDEYQTGYEDGMDYMERNHEFD